MSFTPETVDAALTKMMKECSDEIGEILRERQAKQIPDLAEGRYHAARAALGALSLARDAIRDLANPEPEDP